MTAGVVVSCHIIRQKCEYVSTFGPYITISYALGAVRNQHTCVAMYFNTVSDLLNLSSMGEALM